MANMSYFRRPQLADVLPRSSYASIRGNLRRHDPDGVSAVPYFVGISGGVSTIRIATQGTGGLGGGYAQITLSSDSFDQIITDIQAGIAAYGGAAFDAGGCVGIRSTVSGYAGWVQVVGGTGATLLGFDITAQSFRSIGGDLPSAPEAGLGIDFGSALPNPGEDFTTTSLNRALGRIMANTDILHAELEKKEVVLSKVGTVTGAGTSYVNTGSTTKIFRGAPLSNSSTPAELAPYFFLIDQNTKQISSYTVTQVTNQADANILGVDTTTLASTAILSIKNGRVLTVAGPLTAVAAGDFATISGAANTTPWSNNGARWVIEEVIDSTTLALRPATKAELSLLGASLSDEQPVVELNTSTSGSFGNITVTSGPFFTNGRLHFTPALPAGVTLDVWASVAASQRDRVVDSSSKNGIASYAGLVSDYDLEPNVILSRPALSNNASTYTIGPFMVRWHGKPVRIETQSFTPGGTDGNHTIYWDEYDCQVKMENAAAAATIIARDGGSTREQNGYTPLPSGALAVKQPLVFFTSSGGTISSSSIKKMVRLDSTNISSLTVGAAGQFDTLQAAIAYAEASGSTTEAWIRLDIILLENMTAPATTGWVVTQSVRIRGANPFITLTHNADGTSPLFTSTNFFSLEDVIVASDARVLAGGTGALELKNVFFISPSTLTGIDASGTVRLGTKLATAVSVGKTGITTTVAGPLSGAEGVTGTGPGTSGTGVIGNGSAPNGIGVKGQGDGSGIGVEGIGGDTTGAPGVKGTGGSAGGVGVQGYGVNLYGGEFFGNNHIGVVGRGDGSADGGYFIGGATGNGAHGQGGETSGIGLTGQGVGAFVGVEGTGGSSSANVGAGISGIGGPGTTLARGGDGVVGTGADSGASGGFGAGDGVYGIGGDAASGSPGVGIRGVGGATHGLGVLGIGGSTNGAGVEGSGVGTGTGVVANGGSSGGIGLQATGAGGGGGVQTTGNGAGFGIQAQSGTGPPVKVIGNTTSGHILLDTVASVGNAPASSVIIWFNGTDLMLRIGANDYTITKTGP